MGGALSSTASEPETNPNNSDNPISSLNSSNPTMSSLDPRTPQEPKQAVVDSPITTNSLEESDQSKTPINQDGDKSQEGEGEEAEEEGECGFCLFMKGGGCKSAFVAWEDCIKEAENKNEDIVEKCFEVTRVLKTCMEAHAEYYEPILKAEKAAEEEAVIELENEKAAKESEAKENSRYDFIKPVAYNLSGSFDVLDFIV